MRCAKATYMAREVDRGVAGEALAARVNEFRDAAPDAAVLTALRLMSQRVG